MDPGSLPNRRSIVATTGSVIPMTLVGCLDDVSLDSDGADSGGTPQKRKVVTTYDEALVARNEATETRNTGVTRFNERNYADAIDPLKTALSGYEEAEDGFAEAADLAAEIEEETAVDICETAVDETALQVDATAAALSAARAADEGADTETINGHIERFRSFRDDAETITVADTDAVASALGIE